MSFLKPKLQYGTPSTGNTVTIAPASADIRLILEPAGTLLSLTIEMPLNPFTGQVVHICSTQAVTTLSMTFAGGIIGALTSLVVNGYGSWSYCANTDKWYRLG